MAAAIWTPRVEKSEGPLYLAIAEALADDIGAGRLTAGTRLPPQRALAEVLGIDFTTVSRAYAEAQRRGLVEGRVGQGTYVLAARTPPPRAAQALVDMTMNLPPQLDDARPLARLWKDIGRLQNDHHGDLLMRYQEPGGIAPDRAAGARWLAPRLGEIEPSRVTLCAGAQGALMSALSVLTEPGDRICTEALTYPGMIALARFMRLEISPVAMDADGMLPDAFEALCAASPPRGLYCNPTLNNPTTSTLSLERREAVIATARKYGVAIIEDDPYSPLRSSGPAAFAALAPDLTWHVATLAKAMAPALRIAYLVPSQSERRTGALGEALRAAAVMVSPVMSAAATQWIGDGAAEDVLTAIRAEARTRQAIAADILPAGSYAADPEGYHVWLSLPEPWNSRDFASRLRLSGVAAVPGDAFEPAGRPVPAVRLGLGALATRDDIAFGLKAVASLLGADAALAPPMVV